MYSHRESDKMKYNCRVCAFKWKGNSDTFTKVLAHEKTHMKTKRISMDVNTTL